jgi:nucleotide-binding universal stress UspA family protein
MDERRQWRRLLVPLADGPADEATLQAVADVARSAGSTIRLLYVWPAPPDADADATSATGRRDEVRRPLKVEGCRYLETVASSLDDIAVERVVRFGDLETAILDEAAAWQADLVALSAGDRTWLSRAIRTGTAAKAFSKRGIPALLYTPS